MHLVHFTPEPMITAVTLGGGGQQVYYSCTKTLWSQATPEVKITSLPDLKNIVKLNEKLSEALF
jgi:hypothetical protein